MLVDRERGEDRRRVVGVDRSALDVFEGEPSVYPGLLTVPNVVLTPHAAGLTQESSRRMSEGERLRKERIEASQHFTEPPPRYTEASLVKALEENGIGRPSTYASIIGKIQERGYVTLNARRFYAEKIGELVTDRLVENFDNLLDFGFTAHFEDLHRPLLVALAAVVCSMLALVPPERGVEPAVDTTAPDASNAVPACST